MKNKILYLILIVSIAFNLAFLGMFIWHQTHPPRPRFEPEFRHLRNQMKGNMDDVKKLRDDFKNEKDRFMDYLRTDEFQKVEADSLLNLMLKKQMKMEKRFGSKLIELRTKGIKPDLPKPPEDGRPGHGPGRPGIPRERRK